MGYGSDNWAFVHDYFRFYLDSEEDDLFTVPTSRLFSAPLPSKLDDILHLIVREFYSANKNKDSSLDLLGRLFLLGADELVRQRDALPQKNHDDLLALRIRMLSSSELDWSVEKLAREVHLSPSYFQGVYKSLFGISPINDLIEARIKRAEEYLISSNKKETEIAALTGYRNVEHFIRQFKRIKGCTPSEFRKEI